MLKARVDEANTAGHRQEQTTQEWWGAGKRNQGKHSGTNERADGESTAGQTENR